MGIATLGLVLSSAAVVIGAMLVSPLMGPILELGMRFAVGSSLLVIRAFLRVVLSVLVGNVAGDGREARRVGVRRHTSIRTKMANGFKAGGKTFKVHLDGYDFGPYFHGKEKEGPRKSIFYFDQGGNLNAVRHMDWKLSFAINSAGNIATATRGCPRGRTSPTSAWLPTSAVWTKAAARSRSWRRTCGCSCRRRA